MEKISHKLTAREINGLSQNLQRDLNAVFEVTLDEVTEKISALKRGKMTPEEFMLYIESL